MSAPIKYRAWTGKKMFMQDNQYLGSFIRRAVQAIIMDTTGGFSSGHESYLPNGGNIEEYLMLYTGLQDADGREAYQKDIVDYSKDGWRGMLLIDWSTHEAGFAIYHADDGAETLFTVADVLAHGVVAGNSHENPELLNAE